MVLTKLIYLQMKVIQKYY